jgi:hypothetical protein
MMMDAYNPSYLEGDDQENCSSRSAQANSSRESIFKIIRAKWIGGVAQAVERLLSPEFKPQSHKKQIKIR